MPLIKCGKIPFMSIKKYLDQLQDLSNRKIIITGGTSGIGLSLVKHLLYKNAKVVILARNMTKANDVKDRLMSTYPNARISFIKYDQSDDQSIIEATKTIVKEHQDFYALIMNAGIFQNKKHLTYVDGICQTIKTNFVGLKVLLDNLLPYIKGEHRYIFQGSFVAGYRLKKIKSLKDKNISSWQQYLISKAGVESLYYHYSLLDNEEQNFYLVEPGLTSTDIIRDFNPVFKGAGTLFLKVFSHSSSKASLTAMLALQDDIKKNTYIVPRGFLTFMGYPKIKKFPNKRRKPDLYQMLEDINK